MSTVFTIGHSKQPVAEFVVLLVKHGIKRVVDVRSNPRSRFAPQFNSKALQGYLRDSGIDYLHLGDQLGGHPKADELYAADGRAVYERMAGLREFRRGIERLVDDSEQHCLALMCTEENPAECHRHPLLALALLEHNVQVLHLRRNGSVQDARTMLAQIGSQLPLVEPVGEDSTWRSPKRIRRREHT